MTNLCAQCDDDEDIDACAVTEGSEPGRAAHCEVSDEHVTDEEDEDEVSRIDQGLDAQIDWMSDSDSHSDDSSSGRSASNAASDEGYDAVDA